MKKYFLFKGTISGWSYLWRLLLQTLLIPVLGLGIYLLAASGYKRASALTNKKWLRILATPTLPFLGLYNILNANESDAEYFAQLGGNSLLYISIFFVIVHLWMLFSDSKVEQHNG
jgi:hypothetical protein